jgi:O-antigen/teichoic acid export membrane protein
MITGSAIGWDHLKARKIEIPLREIASYTIPLLTMDLVLLSMSSFDAILVGNMHGTDAVAQLRVVDSTSKLNSLVFMTFSILFVPTAARFFARSDRAGMRDLYWTTSAWIAVLSFPIFACTFSLAEPVTVALFGQRYASSAIILALVSLARFIDTAFGPNGTTIRIFGGIKEFVGVNVTTAVFHIVLTLILVPPFSAMGAAVSILVTYIVYNALKQYVLRRVSGYRCSTPLLTHLYGDRQRGHHHQAHRRRLPSPIHRGPRLAASVRSQSSPSPESVSGSSRRSPSCCVSPVDACW